MFPIFEFSKYYVIFIYFQAAVSALLAVSVLYVEQKSKYILRNTRKFDKYQIAVLMTYTGHYTTKKQFYTRFLCNISSCLYLCSKNQLQFCITDLFAILYVP